MNAQNHYHLLSMTGFGMAQGELSLGQFAVEVRTVNNRFQDVSVNLPRELATLEPYARQFLRQEIARGKVDCRLRFTPRSGEQGIGTINLETARAWIVQLRALEKLGVTGSLTPQAVLDLPGVLTPPGAELNEEALWAELRPLFEQALAAHAAEREREGEALGAHLHELGLELRRLVDEAEGLKGETLVRFREKLAARLAEVETETRGKFEPGRLEAEVALYADRADISEELVRLRAHLDRFEALLRNDKREPVGKNLEFLLQEFTREINTLGSKSRDTAITDRVLAMKSALEKIREQALNIQ